MPSNADGGVPFERFVKAEAVTPGFGPGDRVDPYWDFIWPSSDGGPAVAWRSIYSERTMRDAGVRVPQSRRPVDEALALVPRRRGRLEMLAAVNLWRAVTSQQLVALTGEPGHNFSRSAETDVLIDAGLIQRGRFHYGGRALDIMPEMFRPDPHADESDLRHLSFKNWLGVTLGGEPIRGRQYDRHNILTTELSLRAAEMCPLRSVMGESAATWPRLFGKSLDPSTYRSADAAWIRNDGMRIAVEMTATVTNATKKKIDLLADLLARDKTGSVVVLFVIATDRKQGQESAVTAKLRQAIKHSAHSSGSRILADVEDRMLFVKWEDWFPAPGLVTSGFVKLRAQRFEAKEDDWTSIDLLDPFATEFDHADSPETIATLANLNDVLGAPHWMRGESEVDYDAFLLKSAGITRD